jgi:hypothetical protein
MAKYKEFSTAILTRFHQPSAFPPFPTAKTGPAVQVGSKLASNIEIQWLANRSEPYADRKPVKILVSI